MTITLRQLLLTLGAVLLAVGLTLGLTPVTHDGGPCGSAYRAGDTAFQEGLTRSMTGRGDGVAFTAGCTDALSSRRTLALAVTVPGVLLLGVGALTGGKDRPNRLPI